jgi:hypothetical protein
MRAQTRHAHTTSDHQHLLIPPRRLNSTPTQTGRGLRSLLSTTSTKASEATTSVPTPTLFRQQRQARLLNFGSCTYAVLGAMQANYRKTYKLTKTLIRLAYTIYLHKPCKYEISFSFVRKETRRPPARWQLGWLIRKHPRFKDPSTLLVDQVLSAHVALSTRLQ